MKFFYFLVAIHICIIVNSCKEANEENKHINKESKEESTISPYTKLLDIKPIYRDSVYSVYITTISRKDQIIFLKQGILTDIQRKSKFFLHVYPKDKSLLGANKSSSLIYDFKNNVASFTHMGEKYFFSETALPDVDIDKINIGQYGYNGDNSVNWKIKSVLRTKFIQPIIIDNGDDIILDITKEVTN